jgi:hypothetical protein
LAFKKQNFAEGEIRIFDEACVYKRVVERAINNIGRDIKPMTSSAKSQLYMFLQIDD